MKFDNFFERDETSNPSLQNVELVGKYENRAPGISTFMMSHAGASYARGLYRVLPISEMYRWTANVSVAFPEFEHRIFCFGFDWLGRSFVLDFERTSDERFLLLMLEPGTGEALEIPATFIDFHEKELVDYTSEVLATEFFNSWLSSGGDRPKSTECIGYKQPLFLGGSDTVDNLEVNDLEVYWSVMGQLLTAVRGLPAGTQVDVVHLME